MGWEQDVIELGRLVAGRDFQGLINYILGIDEESAEDRIIKAIENAVVEINTHTKTALVEQDIREIRAGIDAIMINLREVKTALDYQDTDNPQNTFAIDMANHDATFLTTRCKYLDLYDPHGPGLAGHPLFLIAANLKIAVLKARGEWFGTNEDDNIKMALNESIIHAKSMNVGWYTWNRRRFGPVFPMPMGGFMSSFFYYTFEGEYINTGVHAPVGILHTDAGKAQINKAEQEREKRIQAEFKTFEREFVEPSNKVIKHWVKLLELKAAAEFLDEHGYALNKFEEIFKLRTG